MMLEITGLTLYSSPSCGRAVPWQSCISCPLMRLNKIITHLNIGNLFEKYNDLNQAVFLTHLPAEITWPWFVWLEFFPYNSEIGFMCC